MPRPRIIGSCQHVMRGLRAASGLSFAALLFLAVGASAQVSIPRSGSGHRLMDSNQPPGTLGYLRRLAGGLDEGYFQPVRIIAPEGTRIGAAHEDSSCDCQSPALLGLRVGVPYRLRLSHVDFSGDIDLYPSIELLDRLHPPAGSETQFAVPIQFTDEELRMAAGGDYIVKVVYVEDPELALPLAEAGYSRQRALDVEEDQDPLAVADVFGRPIAIVRFGSKAPGPDGHDESFLFGSPVLQHLGPDQFAEDPETARVPANPPGASTFNNPRLRKR